ncbi:B-type lectin plumieribetin-like [Sebastes fasciatus]|uniref:B-type lectin plumieribetin-like n=1 Tax=Sebastes fasciatus TaxID=394691 RepID=UPI003D9DCD8B
MQRPAGNITCFTSAHRLTGVGHSRRIMSKNYLSKNDELRGGDYLMSKNGQWKAIFQDDGNFVLYGLKPVWDSGTYGTGGFRLNMQADSNLVIYNKSDKPMWDTDTFVPMPRPPHHGHRKDCHLELTDGGELDLYRGSDKVWSSATSKGVKRN